MPSYCQVDGAMAAQPMNYDWEVNFNPDVRPYYNNPMTKANNASGMSNIVCSMKQYRGSNVPATSNYINHTTPLSFETALGFSLANLEIGAPTSGSNIYQKLYQDPYWPNAACRASGACVVEGVDTAMTHPNQNHALHTHLMSKYMTGLFYGAQNLNYCSMANTPACAQAPQIYALSMFNQMKTMIPLGLAKDGHIVWGPYNCNGMLMNHSLDMVSEERNQSNVHCSMLSEFVVVI